jgi:dTDP-4-amino-4,6-dideoxygalactose transaminase
MSDRIPLVDLGWQRDRIRNQVRAGFDEVFAQTSFVGGSKVAAFEHAFSEYSGVRHSIGVGNGTDAVELALRAAGVGPGDECVLPVNTFIATAEAVCRTGATPVLVDIDPVTYLMDVDAAIASINERTAAVIPVHLYGRLVDLTKLREVAHQYGATLVEDAAQCHGATRCGAHAGSGGDLAATSFYPTKNLGAFGDGGAVLTNSDQLAEQVGLLRSHGEASRGQHRVLGFNSRLDALQAVVLSAKLPHLDSWNDLRRQAVQNYQQLLAEMPAVSIPDGEGPEHVWHLYVVRVPNRDKVLRGLRAQGIEASVHYPTPIHRTGAFAHLGFRPGAFPVAERAAMEILSLPLFPGITEQQQARVAETLGRLTT